MMGLNDLDSAEIMAILVIAILLISFVWRLSSDKFSSDTSWYIIRSGLSGSPSICTLSP